MMPPDIAAALPAPLGADRAVILGEHRVGFLLRRATRRSIGFTIGPEGLVVSAPRWVTLGAIDAALRAKGPWIVRKLQEQRERTQRLLAARVQWRAGASVPFLGAPLVLAVDERIRGVMLDARTSTLRLGVAAGAPAAQMSDLVKAWLRDEALRLFDQRCAIHAGRVGVRVRRIGLSSARTRWGSAGADGSIRLHWRLIHFRLPVIDYVVVHELAHLREMNHSPAFWDIVRSVLPGFDAARAELRDHTLPEFE